MERILIGATQKSPLVHMDANKGLIEISGRSTPEDTDKVFGPIVHWIEQYVKKPQEKTVVNFHFEYFNSSTTKALMRLINKLQTIKKSKSIELEINWLYFDEDMLEYGQDFEELSGLPFNFVESDYSNINFDIESY
ncbi:MAG: nuclear pore complex subunit [Bacteroidetes bacterium]|nr:MAG: nuclear pore complex subunit [Bacteroidota bacterium]RLD79167.1 MAG: nuclear pore complex subunit [Bacteroidota bacterium]